MISDEKMTHIVHLMMDGLEKFGMVSYPDREKATREARIAAMKFVSSFKDVEEVARQKIESQKNAPPEHSQQWQNLLQNYIEEEMRKRGL